MVFRFFRRAKPSRSSRPTDPVAAYDALLEDLETQGAQVRQSAALLLSVRSDLGRTLERNALRLKELEARRAAAERAGDVRAEGVLARDARELEQTCAQLRETLEQSTADAELLTATAQTLRAQAAELERERSSAKARWLAGSSVHAALREQTERVRKLLDVDAARDEVERAHALAEIYRESERSK